MCSTDRVTLLDTYQYNDSAGDPFHREPYCVKFRLHHAGVPALMLFSLLLSRRSRQRERLSASMVSICSSVCLFVCRQNAKNAIFSKKTKQFRAMVSIDGL